MDFDYKALVNSTAFQVNLFFGHYDFTDLQLRQLEDAVKQICSETFASYQQFKQIKK